MALSRNYLNDEDEEPEMKAEDFISSKRMKHSPETVNEERSQYVRIDFNIMNYTTFGSIQSKQSLNSQVAADSQIFNRSNFFECVNTGLINFV